MININYRNTFVKFAAFNHHEMEKEKTKLVQNRIKAELAEQQKTNHWLAEQLGKGDNTVSRWCSNQIQPSLEMLGKIAQVLNVDVRTLLRPIKNTNNNTEE